MLFYVLYPVAHIMQIPEMANLCVTRSLRARSARSRQGLSSGIHDFPCLTVSKFIRIAMCRLHRSARELMRRSKAIGFSFGRLEMNFRHLVVHLAGRRRLALCDGQPFTALFLFLCSAITQRPLDSPILDILQSHRTTLDDSWKKRTGRGKREKRSKRITLRYRSIQSGAYDILHRFDNIPLNESSFQDALRTFFQPIKNDDARLDFYTMYKKEAVEYDTDYVKKYDEDLNTTLIFVSHLYRSLL